MDTYNSFRMITYKQFPPKPLILNNSDFAFFKLMEIVRFDLRIRDVHGLC